VIFCPPKGEKGELEMMRMILIAVILVMFAGVGWGQNKQIRDANGRLVETWSQHGNTTDVRDRTGSLLERRTVRGNEIQMRDKNGRLLRTEKVEK